MSATLHRDTSPDQGHDLVVLLLNESHRAWVLWRWGMPAGYGVTVGGFHAPTCRDPKMEAWAEEAAGGISAWVVLACSPVEAFLANSASEYDDMEPCHPATAEALERVRHLTVESMDMMRELAAKHGATVPDIIERVIAESHAIGIAVE